MQYLQILIPKFSFNVGSYYHFTGSQWPAISSQQPEPSLPAWFYNPGQLSLWCKITKANSTDTEFSNICSGSTTNRASVVSPHLKFWFFYRFISKRFFCQIVLLINNGFLGSEFTVQGYALNGTHWALLLNLIPIFRSIAFEPLNPELWTQNLSSWMACLITAEVPCPLHRFWHWLQCWC